MGIKVPQYRWAKTIKELDGNKCAFCGSIEMIEAHHIQQKAEAETVSTDLENGITLCHKCHYTAHGADFTTNNRKISDWRGLFTTEPEIMQAFIADCGAESCHRSSQRPERGNTDIRSADRRKRKRLYQSRHWRSYGRKPTEARRSAARRWGYPYPCRS